MSSPNDARLLAASFHDFHTLPVDYDRLLVVLGHALGKANLFRSARSADATATGRYGMVGRSPKMLELYRALDKIDRFYPTCKATSKPMLAKKLTVIDSWTACCGSPIAERNGVCCRESTAIGIASTSVLHAGASMASGKICINILPMTRIWRT